MVEPCPVIAGLSSLVPCFREVLGKVLLPFQPPEKSGSMNSSHLGSLDLGVTGGDGLDDGSFDLGFLVVIVTAFHGALWKVKRHSEILLANYVLRGKRLIDGKSSEEPKTHR